ncbi:MAG: hypothetical protein AAFO91_13505 [Bacteroidota bacterium]
MVVSTDEQLYSISRRHPDQVFVARFEESPATMRHWFHQDLVKFGAGFINWTMTYREDADVVCSYRRWNHLDLRATREEEEREVEKIVAEKSRAAVRSRDASVGL